MLPGIASTSLGPYLLVERGTWRYAVALWQWTAAEVILALAAVSVFGSLGLAFSCSIATWLGIALMIRALRRDTWSRYRGLVEAMVERPAVRIALIFGVAGFALRHNSTFLTHLYMPIVALGVLATVTILADRELRSVILSAGPTRAPRPKPASI
jgi:hypothetical protein